MKKVYINGRFCTRQVSGVERVAWEIIKQIDRSLKKDSRSQSLFRFILLIPKKTKNLPNFEVIEVKQTGRLNWHLWEQFILPFAAKDGLLVNFCNTAPIFKSKQIVFIHDMAVYNAPDGYSFFFRWFYKALFFFLRLNVNSFVTVSHFSKSEIHNVLGIPEEKIHVIKNGADHMLSIIPDQSILTRFGLLKPYVFSVGSRNPNKNFELIMKVMNKLKKEVSFVIAGNANSSIFRKDSSDWDNLGPDVFYLGRVSNEELYALYHHAACFVFPSKYEGFGLPPVEAMYCECPVLSSKAAAIPEICGDAALYFDPANVEDLYMKIKNLIHDIKLRENLKSKGRQRCKKYKWSNAAKQLLSLIDQTYSK